MMRMTSAVAFATACSPAGGSNTYAACESAHLAKLTRMGEVTSPAALGECVPCSRTAM